MPEKKLSWTPVRRGDIYCAPACGGKCTWEKFELAQASAAKLADKLGDGWEPNVWENLGWHWGAKRGELRVLPSIFRGEVRAYTGYLKKWHGRGDTPAEAVDAVLMEALLDAEFALSAIEEVT